MPRLLVVSLFMLGIALPAVAQEADSDAAEAEQAATETEERDDPDLDTDSYADSEDDDFRPSEDIPADQSIPFPTDI